MCTLAGIQYIDKYGNELLMYAVDDEGNPTALLKRLHRYEARNLEQRIQQWMDDVSGYAQYICDCGAEFNDWESVLSHCDMYRCRGCHKPTNKWDGWSYRCPACDKLANPGYHERNPGWRNPNA